MNPQDLMIAPTSPLPQPSPDVVSQLINPAPPAPIQSPQAPPAQIMDLIAGLEPLLYIPPPNEGVPPTPAEQFAIIHFQELLAEGIQFFKGQMGQVLLYRPEVLATTLLNRLDAEGTLSELVNGSGNSEIPKNPKGVVQVTNSTTGERVREVLINSPVDAENAARAASANPHNEVRYKDIPQVLDPQTGKMKAVLPQPQEQQAPPPIDPAQLLIKSGGAL